MKNFDLLNKIVNTFEAWDHNNTYPISGVSIVEGDITITINNHNYYVKSANELITKVLKANEPKPENLVFSYNFS